MTVPERSFFVDPLLCSTCFDRRRGVALATVIGGGAVASITHPPTIELLINAAGWRRACLVLGVVVLAAGLPIVKGFLRERRVFGQGRPSVRVIGLLRLRALLCFFVVR